MIGLRNAPLVAITRLALLALIGNMLWVNAWAESSASGIRFEVSFPSGVHAQPITGRLFLMISRTNVREVRLQSTWFDSPEMIGLDVKQLQPGAVAVIDETQLGTPLSSLKELPSGDYYVQSVLNLYTEFHRADGHVIWAHMDQGEGQLFNKSPGNLYSTVQMLHIERTGTFRLSLTEVIPPLPAPADSEWVKRIRVQSALLTKFWGRPMYIGAVVLLPRDYSAHPDLRYPVIYYQPEHFRAFPPFEFRTDNPNESGAVRHAREEDGFESGYEFQRAWRSDHFPRMIAVSIQTPTPFSDWSGGVDSANNGPYGQAILNEVIPQIEQHFRIIREPYARVLTGKHSGGRAALALQLRHADFFGGVWAFHLWPFNFEQWTTLNIYENDNAFVVDPKDLPGWGRGPFQSAVERNIVRTPDGIPVVTFRQLSQHDAVMASMAGGDPVGADDAILGPVGDNGYPKPLWDRATGKIDHEVADYWREHGDLAWYTQKNWPQIGNLLVGKLHLYIGDGDVFYRNYGVHRFEEYLKTTKSPHYEGFFAYGPLDSGRQPMTNAELVRMMADHIKKRAPTVASVAWDSD